MILQNRYHYSEEFLKKCGDRLDEALDTVPAYRKWKKYDPGRGASVDERYDAMPVLDKAMMRRSFPDGLLPASMDLKKALADNVVEYSFTSGTTSEKVINIFDVNWWRSGEKASWKLNANLAELSYPQKEAELASSLNVGVGCEEDLPMQYRTLGHVLYLNEKTNLIQWQPRHYERMIRELNEYRPVILEANPALLARLSMWALDHDEAVYSPKAILFTYEFTSAVHLNMIRRVFSSPFVSSYGTTETGYVMEQCEAGLLHQNTDFCRIDFQPLKSSFGIPELGRIFVTTLCNPWNYIVRFDVGDLVRLHPSSSCDCGNDNGMIVDAVEGRTANLTFDTAGRPVTTKMLDDRMAELPEIRDYVLRQKTGGAGAVYNLEIMLDPSYTEPTARLKEALAAVYGSDGQFNAAVCENLLPGPAGKFRRTGTEFPFEEKGFFES